MKRIYTSLLVALVALLIPNTIWAADPDLENDYTLVKSVTWGDGTNIAGSGACAYTAYDTGNKKQQALTILTAPEDAAGWVAMQAWTDGSGKGWWNRPDKGLYCVNAGRSACILGDDLTTGWLVVFECSQAASNVMSLTNASGEPDGTFSYATSEDGNKFICTITAAENAYVGFCGNKNAGFINKISVYKPNKAVVATTYSVKYVDMEGNTLKENASYNAVAGATIALSEVDKANITVGETTYVYDSDNSAEATVAEGGTTVVTVKFHAAANFSYTVNEVCGETNARVTNGTSYETANIKLGYRKYNAVNGQLYKKDATSKEYNYSFKLTQDNQVENIAYAAVEGTNNVVFCAEGEDIEGLTPITEGNTTIRSSNSASAFAPADTKITTLAAGKYKIHAIIYDCASKPNSDWVFMAGAVQVASFNCTTVNIQEFDSQEFAIGCETDLIMLKAGSVSRGLDAIYIVKTGDVTEDEAALLIAKESLQANINAAKAIDTTDKEGADELNTAITTAEQALAAQDADVSSINTAISNLVAAVKTFKDANTETIYIEADLTAQFPVDYQGWTGATGFVGWAAPAVTTNDGRSTAACEKYEGTCANTGDVFTRTLTGLANGTYRIELYGAAAYTSGRGFDSELVEGDETAIYLYAETAAGLVKQYIPAHVADNFNGTGIASAVLDNVVISDGTVKLGMYKEKPYTNWHVVQIKGVTAKVDAIELHTAALKAAQTALANEDCAVVTGEERTALETAVTNNTAVAEQTAEAYEAAVKALSEATTAFTAAKNAYADYAAAKIYLVDLPYAKAEKKPIAEMATNAADATAKTAALIPALRAYYESNAMLENVKGAVDMTNLIINPAAEEDIDAEVWKTVLGEGSGGAISILSNEPWTDAAGVAEHKYFDGGNWGANAWDVTLQQEVTLPAGKYLLTAKMRAANDVEQSLFAGENSTTGLSIGAAGGVFDRGWNDTYVEFELTEEATIPIGVRGVTEHQYNWMSFSDFRLIQFPKPELILTLKGTVGEETTLTFGVYDAEDTFTVDFGGEDNTQTAKVGIDNKGPVKEDGTTASATKFTGTVGGDGTIKVYGINDIWYYNTSGNVLPTTFDQPKLMNVVQMSITGADVESVALPAYPKMTQFSFNNSSAKSVDVTKVPTLTSLTINSYSASKYEPQLESIDLSKNTELEYLSLQGNQNNHGKLTSLDLTNNTKLAGKGLFVQYNEISELKLGDNTLTLINVQDNKLSALDFAKLPNLKSLYAANNQLAGELDMTAYATLEDLQVNGNKLTDVKYTAITKTFYVDNNLFTLATIPVQPAGMNSKNKTKKFTYAPQAAMQVAETVSELDLSAMATVAKGELNPEAVGEAAAYTTWIENQTTTFSFVTTGGTALVEGTDYEVVEPGKFKFLKAQTEKVHAVMLNAAFPKFTEATPFTTTEFTVEAAEEFDGVKVTYALKEGETHASGDVVEVKNEDEVVATITYGEAGGAEFKGAKANTAVEGFEAFTEGNGQNGNKEGGTFYTIVPKFDGKIDFAVVLNADKAFYILEDGTALSDFDGITVSEKTYGTITFDVKAGKAYKVYAAGTKLGFYGFNYTYKKAEQPAATELELTLNVERYPGLGYSATEATVDFTEAKAFLGVETITTDMLSIVNPDNTTISDFATYDGWFNGEGAAETWGSNTKVCVKFFQAIAGEGKYEICDMNGADEVGKTYSVKWQLAANDKKVIYTINVTFVEKPVITLTFADLNKKDEQTVALTSELGKCYEGLTADVDVAAILAKLEVSSLNDVTIYAVQSDGSLDDNYKLGTTDGWRNAAGDWQGWGNDAYFFVKADFAKESAQIYQAGGMDGKNTTADLENPGVYTATYAFVKTGTSDAVVLKVTLTYTIPTGINTIATDAQQGTIYNMNGQKVNKAKKGLFIINGKKTVIK